MLKQLLLICLMLIPSVALASYDCSDADNCTVTCDGTADQTDINSAITNVNVDGTITVDDNGGVCTIANQISITKSLNLIGVSKASTTLNNTYDYSFTPQTFEISIGDGELVTFGQFTITDARPSGTTTAPMFSISGTFENDVAKFRVYDCDFVDFLGSGFDIATVYGLFDHVDFQNTNGQPLDVLGDQDTDANGDAAWARDEDFGTINFVYIEDSSFSDSIVFHSGLLDSHEGARVVMRYSSSQNRGLVMHGLDDSNLGKRGAYIYEIYNNTFDVNIPDVHAWYQMRSGTGVIYDNVVTESDGETWSAGTAYGLKVTVYNICPAVSDPACDPRSDNKASSRDLTYPLQDQPGRGKDQALSPYYIWDNTFPADFISYNAWGCDDWSGSGASRSATGNCNDGADGLITIVEEGYDYYYSADDTAEKPAYTPYTYPHPLQGVAEIDTNPLSYSSTGPSIIYNSGGLTLISE